MVHAKREHKQPKQYQTYIICGLSNYHNYTIKKCCINKYYKNRKQQIKVKKKDVMSPSSKQELPLIFPVFTCLPVSIVAETLNGKEPISWNLNEQHDQNQV
jgi:hypothetical protein